MTNPNLDTNFLLDGGYAIPSSQILCYRKVDNDYRE